MSMLIVVDINTQTANLAAGKERGYLVQPHYRRVMGDRLQN